MPTCKPNTNALICIILVLGVMIHADTVIDLISLLVTDTYISHFCDTFIVVSLALFSVGVERF